jgi:hypothetical protein
VSEFDLAEKHIVVERAQFVAQAPIVVSQDDAQQGRNGHETLYILGFGLAGAILANTLVFFYFVLFYAPG